MEKCRCDNMETSPWPDAKINCLLALWGEASVQAKMEATYCSYWRLRRHHSKSMQISWWCLDTQLRSDPLQTVRTVVWKDLIWGTNLIGLQSEHGLRICVSLNVCMFVNCVSLNVCVSVNVCVCVCVFMHPSKWTQLFGEIWAFVSDICVFQSNTPTLSIISSAWLVRVEVTIQHIWCFLQ